MDLATISFLSPKGYGMATLDKCGSLVYLPREKVNGFKVFEKIQVETEPGVKTEYLRAKSISSIILAGPEESAAAE